MESPACREGKGDARGYLGSLTFQAPPQSPEPVLPSLRPSGRRAPAPTLTASPHVISGSPSSELWGAVKIVSACAGENMFEGLPWRFSGKESACNGGDTGLICGLGRSPEEGNDNPLQCSCLENHTDRGDWRATVHGITELDTAEQLTLQNKIL